jgi:transposase-like protein
MTGRHYTSGFKARMVQRLTGPNAPTAKDLAAEVGVTGSTLGRWVAKAGTVDDVSRKKPPPNPSHGAADAPERHQRSGREWPAVEKLRVLGAAAQLDDDALGEFLRREGLHMSQLDEWRVEILAALGQPASARKDPNARRVLELEREVARKDKALAEVTALLVLRKKLAALFDSSEEEGDCTDEKNDKK